MILGNTVPQPDQGSPTPFIIEWIPDILPTMHIGELRLKFEYGHQRNGVVEVKNDMVHTIGSHPTTLAPTQQK